MEFKLLGSVLFQILISRAVVQAQDVGDCSGEAGSQSVYICTNLAHTKMQAPAAASVRILKLRGLPSQPLETVLELSDIKLFTTFASLQELHVTGYKKVRLRFEGGPFPNVRILNITFNEDLELGAVTGTKVATFPSVTHLVMEYSKLQGLTLPILRQFNSLQYLSVAGNNMEIGADNTIALPDGIPEFRSLRFVNASFNTELLKNHQNMLPKWFNRAFPVVEVLDLSGTDAKNLENAPAGLKEAYLRKGSKFTLQATTNLGQLNKLTHLDFSAGSIQTVSANKFTGLSLQVLNLSGNQIHFIERNAFENSKISVLDLSKQVSEGTTSTLKLGSVTPNTGFDVRALFPIRNTLTHLSLADNSLLNSQDNFVSGTCNIFTNMTYLNLANTGLATVYDTMEIAFPKLQELDLSKNTFTSVPNTIIERMWRNRTSLKRVVLSGVKLKDVCANAVLVQLLGKDSIHRESATRMFCSTNDAGNRVDCPVFSFESGDLPIGQVSPNVSCVVDLSTSGAGGIFWTAFSLLVAATVVMLIN